MFTGAQVRREGSPTIGTAAQGASLLPMYTPMHLPSDIPYWMRSIGHHLRAHCVLEPTLPYPVKLNLARLLRLEGAMGFDRPTAACSKP